MTSQDAKPQDSMKFVYFDSPKDHRKVEELLRAVGSFNGGFNVYLFPWNESELKEEQAVLIDFERCLVEFEGIAQTIELIASNLLNDRFLVKNGEINNARLYSYANLLTGIQLQMKATQAEYSGLELARLVCCRPQQSENQAVAQ